MRFGLSCAVAAALYIPFQCLATPAPHSDRQIAPVLDTREISTIGTQSTELSSRASSKGTNKRPKFTKKPRPHPKRPHKHPKDCTNSNLISNGDFNRNVKNWEFFRGSPAQFFWVKNSKKRPSHSGDGQGYIFVNRGYSSSFLTTTVAAVEYGNSITYSAWLRYEAPADLSSCTIMFDDEDASIDLQLTPNWTKYSFEAPGTGRSKTLEFRIMCQTDLPITIYIDDVSAVACVPKKPNPECQVLPGTDNFLVNPGFECPDGITAWEGSSLYGGGNESIQQFSGRKGNPTHSGTGMAGLLFDASQLPYSGVAVFQWNVQDDMKRQTVKASFWLSVDSRLNNVTGCMLSVATLTGYYLYDVDISNLTSTWTKFEIKGIQPSTYDSFQISVYQCTSPVQPLIYLDDAYFGIDRDAPVAPTTTISPPTPTPTGNTVCTSTPEMVDPGFESGDLQNWLLADHSPNYDTAFRMDGMSTYATPHSGSWVGVLDFPSPNGAAQLLQLVYGLCTGQAYTATIWYYVPVGYDASKCSFTLGLFASSPMVQAPSAGVWTKAEVVFYVSRDDSFNYIYVGVFCENTEPTIVLIDDITFGGPPTCSVTPSISDGSFESGDLTIWQSGSSEGDETIAITTTKPRTGKKGLTLTFPSTSNGAGFGRDFDTCVGAKYTFHAWYFVPKAYKNILCTVSAYAYYTGEFLSDQVVTFDTWVEAKLDFVAGTVVGHVDFGVSCLNQLQKVVVYIDDISITTR
ncbi:hypothetical protein BX600DRAFT_441340 [Xylariales sp. PMI_506]|nr:hypothetical protein BX600DRAFT_441340 [Xylariales sp. PMI_506]